MFSVFNPQKCNERLSVRKILYFLPSHISNNTSEIGSPINLLEHKTYFTQIISNCYAMHGAAFDKILLWGLVTTIISSYQVRTSVSDCICQFLFDYLSDL